MEDNNQKITGQAVSETTPGKTGAEQGDTTTVENNPQEGVEWNNYQTKELSGNPEEGGSISAEEAAEVFEKGE